MSKMEELMEEFCGDESIECTVDDGMKIEKFFFALTREEIANIIGPDDTIDVARSKIKQYISTDDFLYTKFNKNPIFWEIKKYVPGFYTVPVKTERMLTLEEIQEKGFSEEEINTKFRLPVKETILHQTVQQKLTIEFGRRKNFNCFDPVYIEGVKSSMFQGFMEMLRNEGITPTIIKAKLDFLKRSSKEKKFYNKDFILVVPDIELHQGKLSSKFDSKDSYNYKKALSRYVILIDEIEKIQDMYRAEQIVMTIGNDSNNSDTEKNTTTAGTEQHNDTRFQQMIINSIVAHVWGVETLKKTCKKVILKFEPGNHDFVTDFMIYQYLEEYFKNDPRVEVKNDVESLRFATAVNFGKNLIIFYHGKHPDGKTKSDDELATLRDTDFKEEAKIADFYTVIASHLHNSSENKFSRRVTAKNGVTVLRTGSPSGDGVWEGGNFYSSDKTHNVYVFDANRGLYSTLNIKLNNEELESAISMAKIDDKTNVKEEVKKAIEKADTKKLDADLSRNEKNIRSQVNRIAKEYDSRLSQIANLLGLEIDPSQMDDKIKEKVLECMGYKDEINPFEKEQKDIESYDEKRRERRKK